MVALLLALQVEVVVVVLGRGWEERSMLIDTKLRD